jgi:hypothetical protein
MELECAKYHEKMNSEQAACRHPADYCQFRTSCMIDFIGKENKRNSTDVLVQDNNSGREKEKLR